MNANQSTTSTKSQPKLASLPLGRSRKKNWKQLHRRKLVNFAENVVCISVKRKIVRILGAYATSVIHSVIFPKIVSNHKNQKTRSMKLEIMIILILMSKIYKNFQSLLILQLYAPLNEWLNITQKFHEFWKSMNGRNCFCHRGLICRWRWFTGYLKNRKWLHISHNSQIAKGLSCQTSNEQFSITILLNTSTSLKLRKNMVCELRRNLLHRPGNEFYLVGFVLCGMRNMKKKSKLFWNRDIFIHLVDVGKKVRLVI